MIGAHPHMAEAIAQARSTGPRRTCPWVAGLAVRRLGRTLQQAVVIVDIDVKACAHATKNSRRAIEFVVRIADHHHGAMDRDLGVQNFAVGISNPEQPHSRSVLPL